MSLEKAIAAEIAGLPAGVRDGALAALATSIARELDTAEEMNASLVNALNKVLVSLHQLKPPQREEADPVAQLNAGRDARRAAAAKKTSPRKQAKPPTKRTGR